MQKIWKVKESDPSLQAAFSRSLNISPLISQLLINRGISDISEADYFLRCDLGNLHDPLLLKDMEKAVGRLKKAINDGESIMVWGDYDTDGITATALLWSVLHQFSANVIHYLPNRIEEGYGLSQIGIEYAKNCGVGLLITVDCGISEHPYVDHLNQLGIDTIVIDHHKPKTNCLPNAFAIVNPLQEGCPYPYKYLSGVGLAYKLVQALTPKDSSLEDQLELVAVGTIADVVPMTGENRTLIRHGLDKLNKTENVGLRALIEVSGLTDKTITSGHIGYILGPRLNASGRISSPEASLKLLLTTSTNEAYDLAKELSRSNRERQKLEEEVLEEALAKVERDINFKYHKVIVLSSERWHPGVIGIVASRLVERFCRPVMLIAMGPTKGKGSGRSIRNFHLLKALQKCEDFLEEYGGHQWACGITISPDKTNEFFNSLNEVADKILVPEDLLPTIEIDVSVSLHQLDEDLVGQIDDLAPFGVGNPKPRFCTKDLDLKSPPLVVGKDHLQLWVTDGSATFEAIGFKMAKSMPEFSKGGTIDLAYLPTVKKWQGESTIQLQIEDIRIT